MSPSIARLVAAVLAPAILTIYSVPTIAATKATTFGMKYEGGSLPLKQHDKLKVQLTDDNITLVQGKHKHAIPVASVVEISYGNDVHRRVGAAVGVGIVTLGIGAMLLLVKTKKHYVGLVWREPEVEGKQVKGGLVLKVGKGEYRGFLKALEGLTGKNAVSADVSD